MHELGLCDALLRMIRKIMAEEELTQVSKVTLEVGELSGVLPKYMYDCWEAVIDGTEFQETKLAIEEIPGVARCLDCNAEFHSNAEILRCPVCSGNKLMPLEGRDMTIKEIEAC